MDHKHGKAADADEAGLRGAVLRSTTIRRASSRAGLLFGCSLAALTIAPGPVAAEDDGVRPARSPSTLDAAGHPLTAADFRAWDAYTGDWGLGAIDAAGAYARGFTGLDIPVAVVDSGIDKGHPKFTGRISSASRNFWLPELVFPNGRSSQMIVVDVNGHGTHVSGTIGASPADGHMMGVAYESRILSLSAILSQSDIDRIRKEEQVVVEGLRSDQAIEYAADHGALVLNGSYGPAYPRKRNSDGSININYKEYPIQTIFNEDDHEAIAAAIKDDVLSVFAAGNDGRDQPKIAGNPEGNALFPYIKPEHALSNVYYLQDDNGQSANFRTDFSDVSGYVIAVVATDSHDQIAGFSNRCGVAAAWCIAAPGVKIESTWPRDQRTGGYAAISGTSMAAPHVTGAAAVLRQAFPFLRAPDIAQILFTTAKPLGVDADHPLGNRETFGWGLLNLGKAIDGPGQFTRNWTVDTTYKGQAYYGTFANDISGIGGLTKVGAGTLELSGTNTYAGGTKVSGGTLAVWRDANLGADGTGLALGGGGRLRVLADGFSTARPVTLDGLGVLRIDGGVSARFAGVIADGAQAGTLGKIGPGTLELAGANSYTGGTEIRGGTLAVGHDANLGAAGAGLTLSTAGTLRILAGGFSTTRPMTLDGAGIVSIDGGSARFAGVIADGDQPGSLMTEGAGTTILSAANTYTGDTRVAGGSGLALTATGRLVSEVFVDRTASFTNAGLAASGVWNLGTVSNTGTIAGGVTNNPRATATNAGTITGGLSNAGLALNTGLISGAVSNSGWLTTSGTIAGSLTNAGQATNSGTITGGAGNTGSLTNAGTIAGGVSNGGTLATSGAITGGLANAGRTQNSGTIAGGVSNSGTLATRGTLAGGLTNTGTVTASAGRIDGAIRNMGGTLAITGAVASDGSLANAAGATLAVAGTGAYSLAGPLTNAGTVAVAQTASLAAPAGLSNAGLVASDGILTTDLTNTGTARLSGQLNGALTNTGSLRVTGPLAGLTRLTNAGPLDLGGQAITLASLSGPASGVIANGALTVTGAASTAYAGAILESTAPTRLTKAGSGTLKLTGPGRFSGPTTVQAGTLSLDGVWASPVTVAAAGTLRGIGTVAAPVAVAGALRPGNSPGTLTVLGPVAFASGSLLGLDIDGTGTGTGAGRYARLLALGPGGAVAANGTLVPVLRGITGNASNAYTPALGQRFDVLVAQAGLSGAFTGLAQPTAGLPAGTRFDALYRATGLDLVVTPAAYGSLAGLGLAQTSNAQAVGAALDVARPAAGTRPDAERARVFDALYAAGPATLPGGLASLSGQAYGDAVMADLAARRLVSDTIDRHLRGQGGGAASFSAGDPGLGPNRSALQLRGAAGAPDQPLASGEGRVWADALYGFGSRSGDRAAAGADLDAGGLVLGVDRQLGSGIGSDTLVGGAFSYLRQTGTAKGQSQGFGLGRSTADSYGGTLYATTRLGAVVLRGTAGLSYADGRVDRTVSLGAGVSRAGGLTSGWDAGVSGFAGYVLGLGLPMELVPEVGVSVDRLTRARVAERGGLASQSFATADLNAARVLIGGRVASLRLDGGVAGLRLEGRAYWAHELADTFARVRTGLFGVPFATRTSALGRDGAVLGVSLTGPVAAGVQLSLSYTGDLRPGANAQVVSAALQARW
ncbi:S8 family serine peptidase [Methylobacterium sp. E-005]|uniref:S8 family serine peptidase n=1 Tax=Methylobacterium sp. E-005 TaxID=2836549 RepID=UPI00244379BC|nr:S8 family serine peptidase [Methylobacterium sp. E-005]